LFFHEHKLIDPSLSAKRYLSTPLHHISHRQHGKRDVAGDSTMLQSM